MSGEFVHLHNHSEYSMLDSICRIRDIIQWAVENSAPAVALTDHGNMFGVWEFYTTAQKAGVNPIVGCEVYVAPGDRRKGDKDQRCPIPSYASIRKRDWLQKSNETRIARLYGRSL